MFMLAGPKQCYSSTMLGYTLDQLFIHLDDSNASIQECMYKVIMACSEVDSKIVLKKAEAALDSSRDAQYCRKIISILTDGYEIIE